MVGGRCVWGDDASSWSFLMKGMWNDKNFMMILTFNGNATQTALLLDWWVKLHDPTLAVWRLEKSTVGKQRKTKEGRNEWVPIWDFWGYEIFGDSSLERDGANRKTEETACPVESFMESSCVARTASISFHPTANINSSWFVFLLNSVVVLESSLTQCFRQLLSIDQSWHWNSNLSVTPGVRNEWEVNDDCTHSANQFLLFQVELAEICAKSERYIGTEGGGMDQSISFLAEEGTVCDTELFGNIK